MNVASELRPLIHQTAVRKLALNSGIGHFAQENVTIFINYPFEEDGGYQPLTCSVVVIISRKIHRLDNSCKTCDFHWIVIR